MCCSVASPSDLSKHASSSSSPLARSMAATVMPSAGRAPAPDAAAAPLRPSLPAAMPLGSAVLLRAAPQPGSDSRCRSVATASSTVPSDSAVLGALLRVLDPWLLSDDRRRRRRVAAKLRSLPAVECNHAMRH